MHWNVVLDNKAYIDYISKILIKNTQLEVEDFLQQVYINIATHYELFDSSRGSFQTFVYWRIMSTRRLCLLSRKNDYNNVQLDYELASKDHEKMEASVELSCLYDKVSDKEREAFDKILLGYETKDSKDYFTTRTRIYRLRDKIAKGTFDVRQ